jgi:glucose/arabinose dehydrogenase
MDVALHPDFAENRFVYFTYSIGDRNANRTAMGRARFDGERLNGFEELFRVSRAKSGGQHFGSRILWLPDNTMLLTIGDGGNPPVRLDGEFIRNKALDLGSHYGKVLRLKDDGTPPDDNPFIDRQGAKPEVYSYGHRNAQGIDRDPDTGRVYANEHGARGGDELNLIEPGANYGWPEVTYSREYFGPRISERTDAEGVVEPMIVWTPSKAPSGLLFYSGDRHPQWRGDLFSGALILEHVRYIDLDDAGNVLEEREIRTGKRVRDVRQGPDGHIYIITDERNGELIRLKPTA